MSIDNVSQTSDYSSGSEKSALRPTIVPSYRSHSQGSISLSDRIAASRVNSGTTYPLQSKSEINHNSYQHSSQQYNPCPSLRGSASTYSNSHSDVMNSQMKALICENAKLKKDVQVLHGKCQKIEDCEKQFASLQAQYEGFVKSSTNRQALERELRVQLEADLRLAQSVYSHKPLSKSTVTSIATQTASNIAMESNNRNREQQLIKEISSLRLMLREKEELILSLLSERHSKSTAFCPQDYDSEDYIASNIVSL